MPPLFGTEYEVEIDRDHMAWEATTTKGEVVSIAPHLCTSHEHSPTQDHRGWIDLQLLEPTPLGFFLPPTVLTLDLEQASIFVEGLTEVGQWAHLNKELGESAE